VGWGASLGVLCIPCRPHAGHHLKVRFDGFALGFILCLEINEFLSGTFMGNVECLISFIPEESEVLIEVHLDDCLLLFKQD
jgi:hypothetical protein